MILYEVVEDFGDDEGVWESFGFFSTYEKANDLIKMFEGYDGYGVCEEALTIREVEIIPDKIEDRVLELLNNCKEMKKECEERNGGS